MGYTLVDDDSVGAFELTYKVLDVNFDKYDVAVGFTTYMGIKQFRTKPIILMFHNYADLDEAARKTAEFAAELTDPLMIFFHLDTVGGAP